MVSRQRGLDGLVQGCQGTNFIFPTARNDRPNKQTSEALISDRRKVEDGLQQSPAQILFAELQSELIYVST